MRQRRTGDPTVTRKPGPNGTALRQENTALRQKITVLEQELAQQRATAKPRQQAAHVPSGLGMEALQAASTKASSGVVGIGLDALEAAKTNAPPLQRQAIEETWESPLFDFDKNTRKALRRLVEDERMEDLREKLPEGATPSPSMHSVFFPYCDENHHQESAQPGKNGNRTGKDGNSITSSIG
jgi:hypothetical protein